MQCRIERKRTREREMKCNKQSIQRVKLFVLAQLMHKQTSKRRRKGHRTGYLLNLHVRTRPARVCVCVSNRKKHTRHEYLLKSNKLSFPVDVEVESLPDLSEESYRRSFER